MNWGPGCWGGGGGGGLSRKWGRRALREKTKNYNFSWIRIGSFPRRRYNRPYEGINVGKTGPLTRELERRKELRHRKGGGLLSGKRGGDDPAGPRGDPGQTGAMHIRREGFDEPVEAVLQGKKNPVTGKQANKGSIGNDVAWRDVGERGGIQKRGGG